MTGFYTRWAIMVIGIVLMTMMTYQQYQRDLSTVSLATILTSPVTSEPVRIQRDGEKWNLIGSHRAGPGHL